MKKYREFWVDVQGNCAGGPDGKEYLENFGHIPLLHLVEIDALTAEKKRADDLEDRVETLRIYLRKISKGNSFDTLDEVEAFALHVWELDWKDSQASLTNPEESE